jgi:hypothetical protein
LDRKHEFSIVKASFIVAVLESVNAVVPFKVVVGIGMHFDKGNGVLLDSLVFFLKSD